MTIALIRLPRLLPDTDPCASCKGLKRKRVLDSWGNPLIRQIAPAILKDNIKKRRSQSKLFDVGMFLSSFINFRAIKSPHLNRM